MIGTGSMTDPYIPLEMELEYVRKALHLIYEHGFGFTVITKSNTQQQADGVCLTCS